MTSIYSIFASLIQEGWVGGGRALNFARLKHEIDTGRLLADNINMSPSTDKHLTF